MIYKHHEHDIHEHLRDAIRDIFEPQENASKGKRIREQKLREVQEMKCMSDYEIDLLYGGDE